MAAYRPLGGPVRQPRTLTLPYRTDFVSVEGWLVVAKSRETALL